jgi:3-oxoacyl-[acyl-carrier protein] reductase
MDLKLAGKRSLVTGSSSGIGEAIAYALAKEGVAVVVHGRKKEEVERVASAIAGHGGKSSVALGDLASDDAAAEIAKSATAAFGGIDIVVNNAGAYAQDDWNSPEPASWLDLFNQNTVSMVRMVKHFAGPMKERRWGRFIQTASGVAAAPMANAAAYAASKSAIVNMTVSLAKGLAGTGVTANAVSPGVILTGAVTWFMNDLAAKQGWAGTSEEIERRFLAMFGPIPPTERLGRVEEVATLVAFVASPLADYINGADLRVDGGFIPTTN